eukprot:1243793-Amphidinium_carterae.1
MTASHGVNNELITLLLCDMETRTSFPMRAALGTHRKQNKTCDLASWKICSHLRVKVRVDSDGGTHQAPRIQEL